MLSRLALFLSMIVPIGSPVFAQENERSEAAIREIFDRGCGDDNGVDRCSTATHYRMRQQYGIPAASELLLNGTTVRRAMFVDGYGNDVVLISFLRRPGESPRVEVDVPQRESALPSRSLGASLTNEVWERAIDRTRFFDEQLARETRSRDPQDDSIRICLHAWFVVVEAVDAPRVSPNIAAGTGSERMQRDPLLPVIAPMEPATVRSDAESACADGLAVNSAFELADMALAALPECSTLDRNLFRNVPQLLGRCRRLQGDRLVAAEATTTAEKLVAAMHNQNEQEQNWLFVGIGSTRAALFRSAIAGGNLYFAQTTGIDADHAEITGSVIYNSHDGSSYETADLTLKLVRQTGKFVIDTFAVGNRRPSEPRSEP